MDRKVIFYLLCTLAMAGCYNSFDNLADEGETSMPQPNATIEMMHELYDKGVRDIGEPLVTYGCVSANDRAGNLFKSFIIESQGYALEVLDGLYDSYVRHPMGAMVVLDLEGLRLERRDGVLRVGLPADESAPYDVDYMQSEAIVDKHIYIKRLDQELKPQTTTLQSVDHLSPGALVRIDGLSYYAEPLEESRWGGLHLFRDKNLDSLWCETSEYAAFAHDNIPLGELSLVGIYSFGGSVKRKHIIRLRSEVDCIH